MMTDYREQIKTCPAKVFQLTPSGISDCFEKYRGIIEEHAVSDLMWIKVYT